jgi:hypothetical protein
VRVVLDHNVPKRLRRFLVGLDVRTAREMTWAQLSNGELIHAAEGGGFGVMITADKNLEYQQNLAGRKLALIVLPTNDWSYVSGNAPSIVAAVNKATPGSFQQVHFPDLSPTRRSVRRSSQS